MTSDSMTQGLAFMACPPEDFPGLVDRLSESGSRWHLVCFYSPPTCLPADTTAITSTRSAATAARVWAQCALGRYSEVVVCCESLDQPAALQSLVEFVSVLPVPHRRVLDGRGRERQVAAATLREWVSVACVPLLLWAGVLITRLGLRVIPAGARIRAPQGARRAVLVPILPDLSHTFVYREVLELKLQCPTLEVFALETGDSSVMHREAAELLQFAKKVPRLSTASYLVMYLRRWLTRPVGMAALVRAFRAHTGTFAEGWIADDPDAFLRLEHLQHSNYLMLGLVLADVLERADIGYVHVYGSTYPALRALVAHHAAGIPFSVSTFVDFDYVTPFHLLEQKFGCARFVVVCTHFCADQLQRQVPSIGGRIRVLHHSLPQRYAAGVLLRPSDGMSRIVFVGRFVPKKGLATGLRAFAILKERSVAFSAHFYGAGPLDATLRELSRTLGLSDRVHFEGPIPNERFYSTVNHDDVFVCPSQAMPDGERDGIPVTLLEAMAGGIAVVSTSVSGIPELIQDGINGFLVPPGDPLALADMLQKLIESPALRKSVRRPAVETVARNFSTETAVADLLRWITQETELKVETGAPATWPADRPA